MHDSRYGFTPGHIAGYGDFQFVTLRGSQLVGVGVGHFLRLGGIISRADDCGIFLDLNSFNMMHFRK